MPGGGLIQVDAGYDNYSCWRNLNECEIEKKIKNIAHEYHTYESEGLQPITIDRLADTVTLEYLELRFTDPNRTSIENNLTNIKKLIVDMEIGDVVIQQFPLSLLINLNEPIICDGKMYINLCFEMLFGILALKALCYYDVKVKIRNNNLVSCISNYGIVSKLTNYDWESQFHIQRTVFYRLIQQISFVEVKTDLNDVNKASNIYDMDYLPFSNISKGFFIECNNVDYLNEINLKFNDQDRFNLNRFLVRTKCKKINQNLLYFPFNNDMNFSDIRPESYQGAPNLSNIDKVKLKLTFDLPINNVKIYSLEANIYRQMSGMANCARCEQLCSDTYDLQNNRLVIVDPTENTWPPLSKKKKDMIKMSEHQPVILGPPLPKKKKDMVQMSEHQ